MDRRIVAVGRLFVAAARREVDGAGDLFVKQYVAHRVVNERIDPERKLADIARPLVGVKDAVDRLEDKRDVLKLLAVVLAGDVVGDPAVDRIAHGRGVDLAVGDVAPSAALDRRDALDRKGEIGAGRDKAHLVRPVHQLDERRHRLVHLAVVEIAHLEVEVLERGGAHARHRAHALSRPAEHDPLCLGDPALVVHGVAVISAVRAHARVVDVARLERIFAAD